MYPFNPFGMYFRSYSLFASTDPVNSANTYPHLVTTMLFSDVVSIGPPMTHKGTLLLKRKAELFLCCKQFAY